MLAGQPTPKEDGGVTDYLSWKFHLMPHPSKLNSVRPLFIALMTLSTVACAEPKPDRELAEGILRCETFYKHYYESLRFSNPGAIASGPLTKLPDVIRRSRIMAEALIGETEARLIYAAHLEKRIQEFTDAAAQDWPKYAHHMSAECISLFKDNDSETRTERIRTYAKAKGMEDFLFAE